MTTPVLLTFNPGSSTIKLGVFDISGDTPCQRARAHVDLRERPARLHIPSAHDERTFPLSADAHTEPERLVAQTLEHLRQHVALDAIAAIGHRVVHGADRFTTPVAISDDVLAGIEALVPLAPLHQPQSVRLIRAIRAHDPGLLQVATFDTAFHATQPALTRRLPLPRALFDAGVKRYGFHGLSYAFVAERLRVVAPELARGRVIVAHLGSGASLCALHEGKSQDASMGFSTLDGIPMATRSGTLDPGVLLHLLTERGMRVADVQEMLYHQSGLLGLSGESADIRDLVHSPTAQAREACQSFVLRIAREVAAMATGLGGLDALVFTAGIGEHQPWVRAAVCKHLAWLGVTLDAAANGRHALRLEAAGSRVAVLVVPTDEESMIAAHTLAVARAQP